MNLSDINVCDIQEIGFIKTDVNDCIQGKYIAEGEAGVLIMIITNKTVSINFWSHDGTIHFPIVNHFIATCVDDIKFVLERNSINFPSVRLNINSIVQ